MRFYDQLDVEVKWSSWIDEGKMTRECYLSQGLEEKRPKELVLWWETLKMRV
jgi:hypothetical protein